MKRQKRTETVRITFSKEERELIKRFSANTYEGEAGFIRSAAVWLAERRAERPTKTAWLEERAKQLYRAAAAAKWEAQRVIGGIRCIPPDKLGSVRKPRPKGRKAGAA